MSLWIICEFKYIELKIFLYYLKKKELELNRIKLVTYNTSNISRLNNTQIQNIIDYMNNQVYVILKTITNGNNQNHMTSAKMISLVTFQTSRISQPMITHIFAIRYWINILIYIENLVVKILIIMGLSMIHHTYYTN